MNAPITSSLLDPQRATTGDWLDVWVRGVRIEADEVRSFELAAIDGALPDWAPGAHVQVQVPGGSRAYSLCGETGGATYQIAVKREATSRGGSAYMHGLAPGDRLRIGAPRNLFALDPDASHHVLIAGGIGITPLLAMLRQLAASGASHELHYFARSGAHAAFGETLSRMPGAVVRSYFGCDAAQTRDLVAELLAQRREGAAAYCCGPTPLMDCVASMAAACGWPAEALRSERFGGGMTPTPAPVSGSAVGEDRFRVRFLRSATECEVGPGETILSAARAAGVMLASSCEQGVCGACLCGVASGSPLHRDDYLSDAERAAGKLFLPCVSRAQPGSCLELDA